ncbi:helix-turn-helix domain-containing protein [Micromonospora zhanjiangensis]|uniref:Scr1 family TA system antitoxin-like transcriptional regulator n=1 Tax=Micromonospora zhanjiangensis TaxID=1522057 RepID=A0ABV8KXA9_9ACTN
MGSFLDLFGEELRQARTEAGLSQEELATKVSYSAAQVSAVENGRRRPTRDFTTKVDAALGVNGRLLRLLDAAQQESAKPWLRPWIKDEQAAADLRWFEPLIIPGLLQTEGYARALLAVGGALGGDKLDEQVSVRLERQAVLHRDGPLRATFVIDEMCLRRPVGGPKVMRAQLDHLLAVLDGCPWVRVHVVPLSVGAYAGLDGPFAVATSRSGEITAYMENQLDGTVVERTEDVREVLRAWESVRGEALPYRTSVEMIREGRDAWT